MLDIYDLPAEHTILYQVDGAAFLRLLHDIGTPPRGPRARHPA
jgi:hypothetical protein